ncbi:MAG: type II secretion system F family protein [Mycobacterium sp.]
MIATAGLLLAAALLVQRPAGRDRLGITGPRRLRCRGLRAASALGAVAVGLGVLSLSMTVALSAALVAGTWQLRRRRRIARRRARQEGQALTSALELLTGELRAGAHPVRAFESAAGETAGSVGAGLRTVAARAGLGADVPAGLRAAAARSRLGSHWERLAACWELAAQQGLPIGVLMRAAQLDIAERQRYCAQVDAAMAGARATATILAALPVLGVALGELLGAAPVSFLSHGSGGWVLFAGVTLLCAGVLWSGRITDRLPS